MVARYAAAISLTLLACARVSPEPCERYLAPVPASVVMDPFLDEISGIVTSARNPDVLWAIEDSGNEPVVYAVSRRGNTIASVHLEGVENVDWEDIALGPCASETCIFVGDVGDNLGIRDDVQVLRFVEPIVHDGDSLTITPERFPFRYPDEPHNAEAMVVRDDGIPVIFTKQNNGHSRVFSFPRMTEGAVATLDDDGELNAAIIGQGLQVQVTGADIWPDGSRVIIRTYGGIWEFLVEGALSAVSMKSRHAVQPPPEVQGESIAYDVIEGGYWSVSEGPHPVLWRSACAR